MVRFWGSGYVINMFALYCTFSSLPISTLHVLRCTAIQQFISLGSKPEKVFMSQFTKCCSTYLHYFKKIPSCSAIWLPQFGIKPVLQKFPKDSFRPQRDNAWPMGFTAMLLETTFSIIPIPKSPQQISSNKKNNLLETISYLSSIEHYK